MTTQRALRKISIAGSIRRLSVGESVQFRQSEVSLFSIRPAMWRESKDTGKKFTLDYIGKPNITITRIK